MTTPLEAARAAYKRVKTEVVSIVFRAEELKFAAAVLIAAQDAEFARLNARVTEVEAALNKLTATANAAMEDFVFLVGREPNILISGDRGVMGLVGFTAKDVRALQMLLIQMSHTNQIASADDTQSCGTHPAEG
jgi:hypothetical protein